MAIPPILYLVFLFSILTFTSSTHTTIKIPISSFFSKHVSSSDPHQSLSHIASASLTRAHHIKNRKPDPSSSSTKTQLYPKSYGGYSIDLSFGTPPQIIPFIVDTGSSLVWFPCTSRYLCSKCSFPNIDPTNIPIFIPKNSSSSKIIGCKNPKCEWILGPQVQSRCQDCNLPNSKNCSQGCPAYIIQYGSGATAGILLSENLNFPSKKVADFLVGCSFLSVRQPAGIVGFGRGPQSLPSQMGLKRFSYCSLSHRFDDSPSSSDLFLQIGSNGDSKTSGVTYTPFRKNPTAKNTAFQEYYYITLRKIVVGKRVVKIPYKFLVPGKNGDFGTIVDSGSTFTFMERPIFELIAEEFEKQMSNYTRAKSVEEKSGLRPCYDISSEKTVSFPEFEFQFKGGAKMILPLTNYFSLVGDSDVVCLTVVTDNIVGPAVSGGPAIILGNYQQQNFYVEYDLENERFGFRPQNCQSSH